MGTLSGFNMLASMTGTFSGSGTLNTLSEKIDIQNNQSLSNGNAAATANANQVWTDSRSLAATSENLDLADATGSGLKDAFGDALVFTTVRALMVKNTGTTADQDLLLSGNFLEADVLNGTSPVIILPPLGVFFISSPTDGFAVTATTADIITVDSQSATITYEIAIIGTV